MELNRIKLASEAPPCLQRAAKVALVAGAIVLLSNDGSSLMAQFESSDTYYFDPENVTLHMFEALGQVSRLGFTNPFGGVKRHFPVNIWYNGQEVAVAIGSYRKNRCTSGNPLAATRAALVAAFCGYYDDTET